MSFFLQKYKAEKVVSEIFFPCCEERQKKKKQTGLRMTTDEDFVFLNFTGCEWKTKFVLLSVYIRRKKNSKPFSFTEAEVAEIKMTTKTEADAFKQSNHISLESFRTLNFFLRAIFPGTPVNPIGFVTSYMKILMVTVKVLCRTK